MENMDSVNKRQIYFLLAKEANLKRRKKIFYPFFCPQAPLNARVTKGRLFLDKWSGDSWIPIHSLKSVSVCVDWESQEDFFYRCKLEGEVLVGNERGYGLDCQESLTDICC